MKLRYLTLCCDFFNQGLSYTDNELQSMGVRLRHESAYITDYIKCKVNEEFSFDCVRINLTCTLPPINEKIREFESIHEIDVPFDFGYFSMAPDQKEEYLIDITENGLKRFCDVKKWDFSMFQKHIDTFRSNRNNVEFYIPNKSCRKGDISAKVYCVQNMTEAVFFIDFLYKRSLIQRKLFAVSWPTTDTYRSNIYRMEWSDDKTVSIYTWTEQLYAQVLLDTNIFLPGSELRGTQQNDYKEQIEKVYRTKMLLCKAIGIDLCDCNIEVWEENNKSQVFMIISLLEKGLRRYFANINLSGAVTFELVDDYLANKNSIEDFKKKSGWLE